ncbi:hypothetical protein [Telluribacter sp.]|jgi:hypothetical protein|uniref:hypothetical protein n=1 Tax=Telluribacter sp. TaxID=1978767 RepID=UPI002E109ABE|nr:hypothetical protein [Telluribacter sp.]
MWSTDSLWFAVALVSGIYPLGNILMGQFDERTPKVRRVGKPADPAGSLRAFRLFRQNGIHAFSGLFPGAAVVHTRLLPPQKEGNKRLDGRTEEQVLRISGLE